jgi:AcrR family transcriptional regulator
VPSDRLEEIVAGAHAVFAARGYRRTQMADVAERVGVSPGTLYNYVEGKEALFSLALRWSLDEPLPEPPVAAADVAGAIAWALEQLGPDEGSLLAAAAKRRRAPADPVAELRSIVAEMYDRIVRFRAALALLEGSARELGELRELYGAFRRSVFDDLARYVEARSRTGALRRVEDPEASSRLLIEAIFWSAYRRPRDPHSLDIGEERAKAAVLDLAEHAFGAPA